MKREKPKRRTVPQRVQTKVLVTSRRICAFCYGINNDVAEKPGQIAHIDQDRNNNSRENLAFLCINHHSSYDTKPSQAKGYTAGELREYQAMLHAYVEALPRPPPATRPGGSHGDPRHGHGISLEVYDRRVPTYRATMQFVRDVMNDLRPSLKLILKFTADVDEAVFLFGESVVLYLNELVRRALRLHAIDLIRERIAADEKEAENFRLLVSEQTELAVWFSEQAGGIKALFAPFLKLA